MTDRTKRLAQIDAWLDLDDEECERRIDKDPVAELTKAACQYVPFLRAEIRDADAALVALGIPDDGRPLAERVKALATKTA